MTNIFVRFQLDLWYLISTCAIKKYYWWLQILLSSFLRIFIEKNGNSWFTITMSAGSVALLFHFSGINCNGSQLIWLKLERYCYWHATKFPMLGDLLLEGLISQNISFLYNTVASYTVKKIWDALNFSVLSGFSKPGTIHGFNFFLFVVFWLC